MGNLRKRLLDYLETLTGERPDMEERKGAALPLYLRERYGVWSTRLFGRKSLLAIEKEEWKSGSPAEYGKHAEFLQRELHEFTVLVLPVLPSYARNRMVKMRIPFIVPGNQAFLPDGVIDLRERFPRSHSNPRETLSPAAQCALLYHLLCEPLTSVPLKDVAKKINYSPMGVTKVKDELEAARICETVRNGRAVTLRFHTSGKNLWDQISGRLSSPVIKSHWTQWKKPPEPALLSVMSALSRRTMIEDDRLPSYALGRADFQKMLERGECQSCVESESANARFEIWSYDPKRLAKPPTVDPLSLFLSLRDSVDERIHLQLETLMEEVKW